MSGVEAVEALGKLLRQHPDSSNWTGGMTSSDIRRAEALLGVSFPASYRRFLADLGSCEAAGTEFLGLYRTPAMGEQLLGTVTETLEARADLRLPHALLVIQYDGMGGLVSLDASRLDPAEEAPVVVWDPGTPARGRPEPIATDFGSYALDVCARALRKADLT